MPQVKLSWNRFVDVDTAKAQKIKQAMQENSDGNIVVDLGSETVRLKEIRSVLTTTENEAQKEKENKYDWNRDRQLLRKFRKEIDIYGGFYEFCHEKKYIRLFDRDGHKNFSVMVPDNFYDASQRWSALQELEWHDYEDDIARGLIEKPNAKLLMATAFLKKREEIKNKIIVEK